MICPDWQYPHCGTSCRIHAACTALPARVAPIPSMVVTFLPAAADSRVTQARTARGGDAGAHGLAVEVHGAGTALSDAAAELRAGHAQRVAQHPQEGRAGRGVDLAGLAVDNEGNHGNSFWINGEICR